MLPDVIIPKRSPRVLLSRALDSPAGAPAQLKVGGTAVDNNLIDETCKTVENFASGFKDQLACILKPRPGRPSALNARIESTSGNCTGGTLISLRVPKEATTRSIIARMAGQLACTFECACAAY